MSSNGKASGERAGPRNKIAMALRAARTGRRNLVLSAIAGAGALVAWYQMDLTPAQAAGFALLLLIGVWLLPPVPGEPLPPEAAPTPDFPLQAMKGAHPLLK